MDTVVWIVQILLALLFGMAGLLKLTQPREKTMQRMGWVEDVSASGLKVIGLLELLAAIGLILPMVTNILPILTPLAAAGLVLTMIGAMLLHIRRGELSHLVPNLVLLALAAFVIYGRVVALPVA